MVTKACEKHEMEQKDYRFSRRDIREHTGWSDGQLKIHCNRLTDLEYLLVHRGGRGHSIVYELLYDGDLDDQKHLMGLIDVEKLRYDEKKSGQKRQKTAPSQGQVRPKSALSQGIEKAVNPPADNDLNEAIPETDKKTYIRQKKPAQSYRNATPSLVAKGV